MAQVSWQASLADRPEVVGRWRKVEVQLGGVPARHAIVLSSLLTPKMPSTDPGLGFVCVGESSDRMQVVKGVSWKSTCDGIPRAFRHRDLVLRLQLRCHEEIQNRRWHVLPSMYLMLPPDPCFQTLSPAVRNSAPLLNFY